MPRMCELKRGRLDVGGVEHDTDGSTEGLGGEVVTELSADDTGVACGK